MNTDVSGRIARLSSKRWKILLLIFAKRVLRPTHVQVQRNEIAFLKKNTLPQAVLPFTGFPSTRPWYTRTSYIEYKNKKKRIMRTGCVYTQYSVHSEFCFMAKQGLCPCLLYCHSKVGCLRKDSEHPRFVVPWSQNIFLFGEK